MTNYIPTCDWFVYIEEQAEGYVRYINRDGRRWAVIGTCPNCNCWEGAVNEKPTLDCPISPEFEWEGCGLSCIELDPGDPSELPVDNIPDWALDG